MVRKGLLICWLLLAGGCAWPVRPVTDQVVRNLTNHPFDVAPETGKTSDQPASEREPKQPAATGARPDPAKPTFRDADTDAMTSAWLGASRPEGRGRSPTEDSGVRRVALGQEPPGAALSEPARRNLDLKIPRELPGSEAPEIRMPRDKTRLEQELRRIYPELPPLPSEPTPQPGPEGRPFTLSDLQRLAAANSPTLRQAVSDVEAARGNLIQAKTYPNPIVSYLVDPSNNNSTAGVQGAAIEQIIRTGGKQRLGAAQAQKDLDNALLALRRARSDLSTALRNAYFTLLVDKETLVVTRAVAQFTDDIYRLQTGLLRGAQVAPYEPSSLRAQAYLARLAYKQAIYSYVYDWKALVATIGLQQLPLSEIAGQVDRLIPYYDFDKVLAHVLRSHTDILTARNGVKRAQYTLKLAQATLVPDLDVRMTLEKDFALAPFGTYHALSVGLPLPIWDQNKGNIIAAQAALIRSSEEAHRVEVTLANNLANAYSGYKNNLAALEEYRRTILPDLVRYYRGIYARRQVDPSSSFNDLVTAQQTLASNVTAYIGVLGNLWSSVVGVADFLQTDDLFQLAEPRTLPDMPDFRDPCLLDCGHPALAASYTSQGGPLATSGHHGPIDAGPSPSGGFVAPHPPPPSGAVVPAPAPAANPIQGSPPAVAEEPTRTPSPFRDGADALPGPQGTPEPRPAAPGR
jgi:cobalt-zinc-cadmium efflux system outer membrane protein